MLGSMLGHLFGFGGTGMFADIMGLAVNLAIIAAVICLVNMLVRRFLNRKSSNDAQARVEARPNTSVRDRYVEAQPVQDIKPPRTVEAEPIQDIKPPADKGRVQAFAGGQDYDPHAMAEKYRNM